MPARTHDGMLWPVPARLVTSGPAFLVGLLVELAVFARRAGRARRAARARRAPGARR